MPLRDKQNYKFECGDKVMLRPEAEGCGKTFEHGVVYVVGGQFHTEGYNSDFHTYTGIVASSHGGPDQWYTGEFVYAGGPW